MRFSGMLLRGAAFYTAFNVLNACIPFLLLPILTRVLVPADYGVLAMFYATLGILGAFTGLSVHGVVNVRYVDRKDIDFPRYLGSCFCVLLISTCATLVVVTLLLNPLSQFTAIPPLWLLLAVLVSGCNFLIQVRLGIWMMAKKPVYYGILQVSLSILNVGLSLFFVLSLQMGYAGRLWGQTVAIGFFAVISVLSLVRGGWCKFLPKWEYMREALAFGVPLMPHVIGGFLTSLADRFIINQQLGLAAAGVYMVAAQIGMGFGLLADSFNKAYVPWLYEQLKEGDFPRKQRIVLGAWSYFVIALVVAAVVALLSNKIILLVAGSEYLLSAQALPWLVFGQAFCGMYFMVANLVFYARKTHILAWTTFVSGCLGVILVWVLTPIIGIAGAGLAFMLSMVVRFLLTWGLAQRVCPMPWFSSWRSFISDKH